MRTSQLITLILFCFFGNLSFAQYQTQSEFTVKGVQPLSADQLYQQGYQSEYAGNLTLAASYYSQALSLDEFHDRARFNRGMVWYKSGDFEKAKTAFNEILIQNPMDLEAYEMRGLIFYQNENYEAAIQDFNQILKVNENADVRLNRGMIYQKLDKYKEALQDFEKVLETDRENAFAMAGKGDIYLSLRQYKTALKWYNEAIYFDDLDPFTLNNRGKTFVKLGYHKEAIQDFERAISIEANSQIYLNLAMCYLEMGDYELAKKQAIQAMVLDADDSETYYAIGLTEMEGNEFDAAIESFDVAIEMSPRNFDYYLARASAASMKGDFAKVIEDCQAVLSFNAEHSGAQEMLQKAFSVAEQENQNFWKRHQFPLEVIESIEVEVDAFGEDPYDGF